MVDDVGPQRVRPRVAEGVVGQVDGGDGTVAGVLDEPSGHVPRIARPRRLVEQVDAHGQGRGPSGAERPEQRVHPPLGLAGDPFHPPAAAHVHRRAPVDLVGTLPGRRGHGVEGDHHVAVVALLDEGGRGFSPGCRRSTLGRDLGRRQQVGDVLRSPGCRGGHAGRRRRAHLRAQRHQEVVPPGQVARDGGIAQALGEPRERRHGQGGRVLQGRAHALLRDRDQAGQAQQRVGGGVEHDEQPQAKVLRHVGVLERADDPAGVQVAEARRCRDRLLEVGYRVAHAGDRVHAIARVHGHQACRRVGADLSRQLSAAGGKEAPEPGLLIGNHGPLHYRPRCRCRPRVRPQDHLSRRPVPGRTLDGHQDGGAKRRRPRRPRGPGSDQP